MSTTVRIGPGGARRGVLLAVACLAVPILIAVFARSELGAALYAVCLCLAAAAGILYTIIVRRANVLVIDDQGLLIRTREGETRYRWETLLEVGWAPAAWPYHGSGLILRPTGPRFATPGPNAPAQVATFPVFGRAAHAGIKEALRDACTKHDVVFADNALAMVNHPPPRT